MLRLPKRQIRLTLLLLFMTALLFLGGSALATHPPISYDELDQLTVPLALAELIDQTLNGPQNELAAIDYARALSDYRASLAELQPKLSASLQGQATSPFSESLEYGIIAGPSVTYSLPTGQGRTDITLGAALRTGYEQTLGAASSLSVRVPLLAGPDNRRAIATQNLRVAQSNYLHRQRQLVIQAMEAYSGFAQAQESVTLATRLRALSEEQYAVALEQEHRGVIPPVELYRMRSGVNTAFDEETAARRRLAESKHALRSLVGEAPGLSATDESVMLHVKLPMQATDLEDWIQIALTQRDDVALARDAEALAEAALAKVNLQSKRDIAFTANALWPRKVTETTSDLRTEVQAGIQATFFLSDVRRAEAITSAELALDRTRKALRDLEQAVERAVRGAFYDIAESQRALSRAREQLHQDELLLTVVVDRLDRGLALMHDVAAQELAVAQQKARIRTLEMRLAKQHMTLWHTVGLDPVELNLTHP